MMHPAQLRGLKGFLGGRQMVVEGSQRDVLETDVVIAERLAAIVESSFDAIISKDTNSIITSWNSAASRVFGYTAPEAIGQSILMLIPPELQGEETAIIERIRRGERVPSFDTVRLRKDGRSIFVSVTVSPIHDAEGSVIGASKIVRDITAAKEDENRIRMLMREVNHRVKNQYAVILSIIRETRIRAATPAEFEGQIRDRIMALSRSHDLLVNSEWLGTGLFELIADHLSAFGQDEKISLSGPLLSLAPNAVQNLGMAIHELGTNAAKYGAFAHPGGQVHVSWQRVPGDKPHDVCISWQESFAADPDAMPEERKGFGSVVLERVVPISLGGTATVERLPGQVTWTLMVPETGLVGGEV